MPFLTLKTTLPGLGMTAAGGHSEECQARKENDVVRQGKTYLVPVKVEAARR